jgi:hypothetical protein
VIRGLSTHHYVEQRLTEQHQRTTSHDIITKKCTEILDQPSFDFQPITYHELRQLRRYSSYATGWSTDRVIFLYTTASESALQPTHLPSQRIPRPLPAAIKRLERTADHSPQLSVQIKHVWSYTASPSYIFMTRGVITGTTLFLQFTRNKRHTKNSVDEPRTNALMNFYILTRRQMSNVSQDTYIRPDQVNMATNLWVP